jgi:hypothetical protein
MSVLTSALCKPLDSPEGRALRRAFPRLQPEVLDLAPDEGVQADYYLSSPQEGISLKHTDAGRITDIFLMNEGKDGYSQFVSELPDGLSFASAPAEVRRSLGAPEFELAESSRPFAHGEILRYQRAGYASHIQFTAGGKGIELITLMCTRDARQSEA